MQLPKVAVGLCALCLAASLHSACLGAELPANWPWRGVAVAHDGSNPPDVKMLVESLGINSISLQLKPRLRSLRERIPPREALQREFRWAAGMLDACRDLGIVGLLVFYEFPIDPSFGYNQKASRFWNNATQVDAMVSLAGELAAFFKDRGSELAGYQIQSEPSVKDDDKPRLPANWAQTNERVLRAIRAQDPGRWFITSLTLGANPSDYGEAVPLRHGRVVYNAHMYLPHQFTHQGLEGHPLGLLYPGRIGLKKWDKDALQDTLRPLAAFSGKYGVPVWIGEFSAARWAIGAEQYLDDIVDVFNANTWGWCYYSYGGVGHAWNPDYDTHYAIAKEHSTWKDQFQGKLSARWNTLFKLFGKTPVPAQP